MGVGMWVNGRFVELLGLDRIIVLAFGANLVGGVGLVVLALTTAGRPPFAAFVVLLAAVMFFQQMLIPNLNAAAMQPLGEVAGTGAALLGMVPGVGGAVIGSLIDRRFDGSVTPLAIGFVVSSSVAFGAWRWASTAATR